MSNYEIDVTTEPYEVEIGGNGGTLQASLAKAGKTTFQSGNDAVSVSFTTAIDTIASFSLLLTIQNTLDSFPQDLTVRVSAFSINGFTAKVNAPPDTNNYTLNWMLVPILNG